MSTVTKSVSFEKGIFEKMEEKRGLIPRSAFINDMLQKSVGGAENEQ